MASAANVFSCLRDGNCGSGSLTCPLCSPPTMAFDSSPTPSPTCRQDLFYYRVPDAHDIAFLRAHIQGGVFLDIGANVGSVSLLLADRIDTAILFEPNPVAAARARENIALNRLSFEVDELAVSDVEGTVEFEDAGGAAPCNRTVVGFESQVPTRTVQRVKIDEFVRVRPDLGEIAAVKIDVEGHENSVLRGMKRLESGRS